MTARVTLSGIGHSFGDAVALSGIDLDIAAGEYVTLLGPSGCGKTTLLSILGGFLEPTRGRVELDGRDVTRVPPAKRPTATMFQDYALFPHMSLRDNVAFGLRMAGVDRKTRHAKALERLDLVGLKDSAHRRPHELSGGQRQRVALARALAVEPEVLLLDEPLGALDLKLRRAMQDELKAIQRRVGTTFVHVTHDQEEAMAIADRIVVMNAGRIEDQGPPAQVYRRPASLFSAGFMGEMNRIPGRTCTQGVDTPFGMLDIDAPASGALTLCLRPEAIRQHGELSMSGVDLGPATVLDAAFFGTHTRAHLRPDKAPDLTLVAHLPADAPPRAGTILRLSADPADLRAYPAE
ncbi:ABC transporter ATP-binding protein [Citreimonas sp.]|uniref:ABC transporter ATP-binding protein n=1 Tax=Citreimonas sp. TaxID=3036715 RepID=UPI00405933A1